MSYLVAMSSKIYFQRALGVGGPGLATMFTGHEFLHLYSLGPACTSLCTIQKLQVGVEAIA
jgi:hypothetical protein